MGLYVTSYLSTLSTDVDQETRTEVGLRKVTVMFSGTPGPPGIEPVKIKFIIYKIFTQERTIQTNTLEIAFEIVCVSDERSSVEFQL